MRTMRLITKHTYITKIVAWVRSCYYHYHYYYYYTTAKQRRLDVARTCDSDRRERPARAIGESDPIMCEKAAKKKRKKNAARSQTRHQCFEQTAVIVTLENVIVTLPTQAFALYA